MRACLTLLFGCSLLVLGLEKFTETEKCKTLQCNVTNINEMESFDGNASRIDLFLKFLNDFRLFMVAFDVARTRLVVNINHIHITIKQSYIIQLIIGRLDSRYSRLSQKPQNDF